MPAPRLLPPTSELVKLIEQGYTHKEIADWVERTMGVKVSRSSVSAALHRAGLSEQLGRYRAELPWRVKGEHLTQYPARMLRLLGRRNAGVELSMEDEGRLDAWLTALEEQDLVVAYVPDGQGFIYVEADEVDDGRNHIPIRARPIEPDELP